MHSEEFESPTPAFGGQCSIQLSYECLGVALATDGRLRHSYFAEVGPTDLSLNAQRSITGQRQHSGVRALHR